MSKPSKADLLIYKALNKAIEKDQLRIYLDYGKINRPGSPVYDAWENLLPVLTPVLTGLILILSVSVIFGLSFMIAMIMIYTAYFKKKVDRCLIQRTKFCNLNCIFHVLYVHNRSPAVDILPTVHVRHVSKLLYHTLQINQDAS